MWADELWLGMKYQTGGHWGSQSPVGSSRGCKCLCAYLEVCVCSNYFFLSVCVCGDSVIRAGWREEGLSEVIFPSHLIIGSLADSLDGSTARCCCAAVSLAVNACTNRCQSPLVSIFNWGLAPAPLIRKLCSFGSLLCFRWAAHPSKPLQMEADRKQRRWSWK